MVVTLASFNIFFPISERRNRSLVNAKDLLLFVSELGHVWGLQFLF
jgi:hypothetical protein